MNISIFLGNNNYKLGGKFMNILQKIALVLVIIGALNWGLVGIFKFDLVAFIFDNLSTVVTRIIYSLVGIAGLISISSLFTTDHDVH